MNRLAHVGFALGVAALALGITAQPAAACSGSCASDMFWVDAALPANGALLAFYSCQWGTACTSPDTLEITHAQTGATIAGALWVEVLSGVEGDPYRSMGARYVFRPERPFEAGTFYRVKIAEPEVGQAFLDTEILVQAGEAADLDSTDGLSVEVALNQATMGIGEATCCADPSTWSGGPRCYSPRAAIVLQPVVLLDGPSAGQWLGRLRLLDASGEPGEIFESDDVITETQDEYCFEVELERAIDGHVVSAGTACQPSDGTVLEEIELECEGDPAGDSTTGERDEATSPERARDGGGCAVRLSPASSRARMAWPLAALFALIALRRRRSR